MESATKERRRIQRKWADARDRLPYRPLIGTFAGALIAGSVAPDALAQATTVLGPVVVTATRTEAPAYDVPASVDRVDSDTIRDNRAQVSISESLGGVPGLLARDRQNYAQDVQISVRGFGARSTFGIRGVRLYVDGIPATLPDGQGQISNVDLGSADRIEILRGPFSALYGNSSGGVIQVFTEDPAPVPTISLGAASGSDGMWRFSTKFSGTSGAFGVVASLSDFETDGFRDHSQTKRQIGNLKLRYTPDDATSVTVIANSVALPYAQDPMGLTRAQYAANPRGVDPSAISFNTRKTVNQTQFGLIYERRLDASNSIRAVLYDGHRGTEQFQSIPVATQANPLNPGGVILLGRDYQGADLRWTWKASLLDRPMTLVAGLAYDGLLEHRLGYQNFIGTTLGVQGALRRDESNDVDDLDQYLQLAWQLSPTWWLNAGVRHSRVRFTSKDAYIVGTNPDDSGGANYSATLPVFGLMHALDSRLHVYVNAGRGFETPTLNELAYRPNGATGLNLDLQAATSTNFEIGLKARLPGAGDINAAVFETRTSREIVTLSNVGGRSTYQNAGGTQRRGLELSWSTVPRENWHTQLAYTLLDAHYSDAFATCSVTPCTVPDLAIAAGSRLPGVARNALFAAVGWAPPQGFRAGIEARLLSKVFVNDPNSDYAAGFATASANVGYVLRTQAFTLNTFLRSDNLFDKRYAGSVIVNEGNSRFFEPAPGRTWLAGISATVSF